MANSNRPFGLKFVGKLSGSVDNVRITRYRIPAADASATFIGDTVQKDVETSVEASGLANMNTNFVDYTPYVKLGVTSTNPHLGVVAGLCYNPADLSERYRLALTDRDVLVVDDPDAIFEIQSDVTGISVNNLNMNCDITCTTGNTTTGVSKWVATGPATGATLPLKILGMVRDGKNEIGAYCRILVMFNRHQLREGIAGV